MRSQFEMSKYYNEKFENYLLDHSIVCNKPYLFIKTMKSHLNIINFMEVDNDDFSDLRNPLIVVLGDSVSGGHFEAVDITQLNIVQNLEDSYVEKFKSMLHQKFPLTVPNIINSALAGDNIKGMYKRLIRDVICFQPDLVMINATLNWSTNRGTLEDYQFYYEEVIKEIQNKTDAEIILLTPNKAISSYKDTNFKERVDIVRKLSQQYKTSLVDIYRMWDDVVDSQDLISLLSNQENHPTPLGHTFIAKAIMQLFDEEECV